MGPQRMLMAVLLTMMMLLGPCQGWLSCQYRSAGLFQISNSNGPIYVYCDGSNNVLLQKSQSNGCPTYVGVNSLTPSSCGYVPETSVSNIAQLSTTVTLYSRGTYAVNSDLCAIKCLRRSDTWQYAGCSFSGPWIWKFMQSENTCPAFPLAGDRWPDMYWGCGYAETVHWVVNIVHHKDVAVDLASLDSSTYVQMGVPCGVGTVGFPISGCRTCTISSDCSGHTISVSDDGFREQCVCVCQTGYTGSTCSSRGICTIALDCNPSYTSSVSGYYPSCTCSCINRYSGSTCSTPDVCTNSQDCSGHAASVTGTYPSCGCTCTAAYTGSACQLRYCVKSIDCVDSRTRYVTGTYPGCVCYCVLGYGGATCKRTLTKSYSITLTVTPDLTATDTISGAWSVSVSASPVLSASYTTSRSALTQSSAVSGTVSLSPAPSTTLSATFSHTISASLSQTAFVSSSLSATPSHTLTPSASLSGTPSTSLSTTSSASPSTSATSNATLTTSITHTDSRATDTLVVSLTQTLVLTLSPSATQQQSATKTITLPRTPTASVSWSPTLHVSASDGTFTSSFTTSTSDSVTLATPSHSSASMTATACLGVANPEAMLPVGAVGGVLPVGVRPRADCDIPTAAGGVASFQIPRRMSRSGRPLCLMVNNIPLSFYLHLIYPAPELQELHLNIDVVLENTTILPNGTVVGGAVWSYMDLPVKPFMLYKQTPSLVPSTPSPTSDSEGSTGGGSHNASGNASDPIPWIPLGASAYSTTLFVACAAIHIPIELVLVYEPTSVTTIDTVSTAISIVTVVLGGNAAMGISIPLFAALTCDGGEVVAPVSQLTMRMISLFYDVSNVAVVFGNIAVGLGLLLLFAAASYLHFRKQADAPLTRSSREATTLAEDPLGSVSTGSSDSSIPTNEDDIDECRRTARGKRVAMELKIIASCGACRFPSWPMVLVEFLMPGVVYGSMLLMISSTTTGGGYVAAFFGLLISAAFPAMYYFVAVEIALPRASWCAWPPPSDPLHPAYGRGRWLHAIFPSHQWRSGDLRRALNPFISTMKPSTTARWRAAEVAMTLVPGIGAALSSGSAYVSVYGCLSVGFVIAAIYLIFALLLVVFEPYRMPLDKLLAPPMYTILGISLLVKMVSAVLAQRPVGNESTEASLTLAAAALQIVLVVSQLLRSAAMLYILWLEGQPAETTQDDEELTEKLNRVEDDRDPANDAGSAIDLVLEESDDEYADNDDVLQFTSVRAVEVEEEPDSYFGIAGYFSNQNEDTKIESLLML
ncbi:membrane-associated protein, putative [Bodo saltans]|uniref:Membrane-associated protein, putative n=1 Tax=Bodo saltans TaxID=75058 RepID=A0A0S4J8S4_BODSA|nr:membrane-associated protein, putative [Bodo saltans]|eukprot:CUG84631.1 membrane-associated protein, putative [Bodo saltans]